MLINNFKKILLAIVFVGLSVGSVLAQSPIIVPKATTQNIEGPKFIKDKLAIQTQDGKTHNFSIDVAITPEQMSHGMMFRTEMADDFGMLFVFGDEARRSFFMKNTRIPLDMVFTAKDGTIRHIHPNAIPGDLSSISPDVQAFAVLEIKGGMAQKLDLKNGDKLVHSFFESAEKQ